MQKTEYLKLNKPDSTDFFSVDHQNQNMELIDAELAKKADKKEIENIKADLTELDNSKLKGYVLGYTVPVNTGGWHKIAQITGGHFNFDLYVTGNWVNQRKSNAHFQIQNINGIVRIVQLSGLSDSGGGIRMIRMVRVIDDRDTWILEENSTPTSKAEFFRFVIAGYVTVTSLDGSVDTSINFKDSVSLEVSDVPTGTVITTSNIDNALSSTSVNPVQNKVVKAEFDKVNSNLSGKANSSHTHTKSEVGLGNVNNTADANKSVKYATSAGSAPANGGNSDTVNGHTVNSDVPTNAKFTDTIYTHPTNSGYKHIPSGGSDGQILEWSSDGTAKWSDNILVDSEINNTSTNPVQNKVVKAALDGKMPVYSYNGGTFDADDLTSPAIHLIDGGGTNLPASCSGGVLLVAGGPQPTQYFFPLYNGDDRIHMRYLYHGTEWTNWTILGLRTTQSTAITTAGKYALDAVQNNASVSGTLANKISPLTSAIILAAGFNKESGQLFKINRTVTLNGRYSSTTNFTQSDFTTIGTLPSGFRPTTSIYGPATVCNTNTVYPAIVRILTTGKVQVYTNNLGQYSELCVTFIV